MNWRFVQFGVQEVLQGMVRLLCGAYFHVEAEDEGVVVEVVRADAEDCAHGGNDDFWLTIVIKHSCADAERVAVHFDELYAPEHWVEHLSTSFRCVEPPLSSIVSQRKRKFAHGSGAVI